jgi:hypothetical protein
MNENNYGFKFNDITIINDIFNKKSKNELGKIKINNEIDFYLYINKNNISFPMPELLNVQDGEITIQYISNAITLTNTLNSLNMYEFINQIKSYLYNIHCIQKEVSFDIIETDLTIELQRKVIGRFNEFDWETNFKYKTITSVNNIKIKNIEYYSNIIKTRIILHLKNNNRDYYNIIHGDTHLGNIILDKDGNLYFIDPRGYFGETKLFGLYEYDYAKLLFGLSGYSVFDNMVIDELTIVDNNLEIDFIKQYESIFEKELFDETTRLLCLSIWLANNSCFTNINKKIMSLMIAYYYCEKYIILS